LLADSIGYVYLASGVVFCEGERLIGREWKKTSVKCDGTVQIVTLNNHAVSWEPRLDTLDMAATLVHAAEG